ncbi:MAG: sensor histidine kinase, partial [Natronospirillum sp.]
LRPELEWRAGATAFTMVLIFGLLWRRSHPMPTLVVVHAGLSLLSLAAYLNDVTWEDMYTHVFVLVLPYTLVRWSSGRHIAIGMGIVIVNYVAWIPYDQASVADSIGGGIVFLFPAIVGAAVRFRERAETRQLEQFKLREREQLARELHDSVAHYVSAIAVQAQAGLAVAHQQPQAALTALSTIETSSRQALSELRSMVRTLRDDDQADRAPQPKVADIPQLANQSHSDVPVHVSMTGELDDLSPAVSSALYRLAQESITNALRHARQATQVSVTVVGQPNSVRITVRDDGTGRRLGEAAKPGLGYGLVGMSERAALLGGTFDAGWQEGSGWQVTAELPKQEGPK